MNGKLESLYGISPVAATAANTHAQMPNQDTTADEEEILDYHHVQIKDPREEKSPAEGKESMASFSHTLQLQ